VGQHRLGPRDEHGPRAVDARASHPPRPAALRGRRRLERLARARRRAPRGALHVRRRRAREPPVRGVPGGRDAEAVGPRAGEPRRRGAAAGRARVPLPRPDGGLRLAGADLRGRRRVAGRPRRRAPLRGRVRDELDLRGAALARAAAAAGLPGLDRRPALRVDDGRVPGPLRPRRRPLRPQGEPRRPPAARRRPRRDDERRPAGLRAGGAAAALRRRRLPARGRRRGGRRIRDAPRLRRRLRGEEFHGRPRPAPEPGPASRGHLREIWGGNTRRHRHRHAR
jgi:hypothetical protein